MQDIRGIAAGWGGWASAGQTVAAGWAHAVCGCLLGFCARRATPPSSAADCLARVLDQGAFLAAIEAAVQVRLRQYKVCVGVWVGWSCVWMESSMAGAEGRTVSPLALLPAP